MGVCVLNGGRGWGYHRVVDQLQKTKSQTRPHAHTAAYKTHRGGSGGRGRSQRCARGWGRPAPTPGRSGVCAEIDVG